MHAAVALLAGLSNAGLSAGMPAAQLPYDCHARHAQLRLVTLGRDVALLPQV